MDIIYNLINGKWCIYTYSAFSQGAFHRLCSTFTHSFTDDGGNHARHQPAHQEQLGVQSLDQGLWDTNSGGAQDWTGNLPWTLPTPKTANLPLSHWHPYTYTSESYISCHVEIHHRPHRSYSELVLLYWPSHDLPRHIFQPSKKGKVTLQNYHLIMVHI